MLLQQFLTNADAFPQFLVSKIVIEDGILKKHPCDSSERVSSHKDKKNWMALSEAIEKIATLADNFRLGYSITRETKIFFIDIDHCIVVNPITGEREWSPLAVRLMTRFPKCFIEVSQSGTGLHIIGRYTGDAPPHINKNDSLGIELYTHDRFVMFGGISPRGDWNHDDTDAFLLTVSEFFSAPIPPLTVDHVPSTTDEQPPKFTDEEVIKQAREYVSPEIAGKVFGNLIKATFSDLFDHNVDILAITYPSQSTSKPYNGNSADLAMANMLVLHTMDYDQIERIMWMSGLARDKWTNHKTYLTNTINKAIRERQAMLLQRKQSNEHTGQSQQISGCMPQEFDGCYYVKSESAIYSLSHGLCNKDNFNMCYQVPYQKGSSYINFQNHANATGRIIEHLCFRPNLPHGEIVKREGQTFINTYYPIPIEMKQGNVKPFLDLISINYPVERDQRILISYFAALVQNPGIKANWCPVLQGVEGCGKSLLIDFVKYAIGSRYTYKPKGDEIEGRFNSQMFEKTFLIIDDIVLKTGKLDEFLKAMITSTEYSCEGKGTNSRMKDFPANFVIATNDIAIVQKREDSRRFAPLMSEIQTPEDKLKAGLTNGFFDNFINWRNLEGFQTVAYFLHNHTVDQEFDFSKGCNTAPNTSTTSQAIEACRSDAESIILEAIASGRMGFQGGFISSTALTSLFSKLAKKDCPSPSERGRLLKEMGYCYHPGLYDGRASRNLKHDNARSRLFINRDHPAIKLVDREAIMKAYEDAQD